jgi:hypothetical protein
MEAVIEDNVDAEIGRIHARVGTTTTCSSPGSCSARW